MNLQREFDLISLIERYENENRLIKKRITELQKSFNDKRILIVSLKEGLNSINTSKNLGTELASDRIVE